MEVSVVASAIWSCLFHAVEYLEDFHTSVAHNRCFCSVMVFTCLRSKSCVEVCISEVVRSHLVEVVVFELEAGISASLLPLLAIFPSLSKRFLETIVSRGEFLQRDVKGGTLAVELLDLLLLLLNVLSCTLEDGAFVLLGTRYDLGNVLDSFVDDLSSTSLNCRMISRCTQ